jgi:hypothetical protein
MLDIVKADPFALFRGHAKLALDVVPSVLVVDSLYKSNIRIALRMHLTPLGGNGILLLVPAVFVTIPG